MDATRVRRLAGRGCRSPALWTPLLVEPGLEEIAELHAALLLGEVDEVLGRHVAVLVVRVPAVQDLEEGRVAHLLAQRLQGHRPAVIDRGVKELARVLEGGRGREPELLEE